MNKTNAQGQKMITKILKAIEEFEAVRAKATPGPWYDHRGQKCIQVTFKSSAFERGNFDIFRYPTRTTKSLVFHEEWEANIEFLILAANHATRFTAALKVAVEALQELTAVAFWTADNALEEIESILEEND